MGSVPRVSIRVRHNKGGGFRHGNFDRDLKAKGRSGVME